MNWKRWKLGFAIALGCGLLNAGAGLAGSMDYKAFIAILCMSLLTNLGNFLKQHPIESIADDAKPGTLLNNLKVIAFALFVPVLGYALGLVLALFLFTGCASEPLGGPSQAPATNQVQQIFTPDRTARAVRIASSAGTRYALREDPKTRAYFEAAVLALDTLLVDADVDPQHVRETLAQLTGGDANSIEWDATADALSLYEIFFGDVVAAKLSTNEYLLPVLTALRDGVRQGLDPVPVRKDPPPAQ